MEITHTKTVHAKIDCHKCKKEFTQYLHEPPVSEVVRVHQDKDRDFCLECATQYKEDHPDNEPCQFCTSFDPRCRRCCGYS